MSTTTLITIGICFILAILVLVAIWITYKLKKIKKDIPQEVIKHFTEAERRYLDNQHNGRQITGEQVLYEHAISRGDTDREAYFREQSVESGNIPTEVGRTGPDIIQNGTIESDNVPKPSFSGDEQHTQGTKTVPNRNVFSRFFRRRGSSKDEVKNE